MVFLFSVIRIKCLYASFLKSKLNYQVCYFTRDYTLWIVYFKRGPFLNCFNFLLWNYLHWRLISFISFWFKINNTTSRNCSTCGSSTLSNLSRLLISFFIFWLLFRWCKLWNLLNCMPVHITGLLFSLKQNLDATRFLNLRSQLGLVANIQFCNILIFYFLTGNPSYFLRKFRSSCWTSSA